MSEARKALRSEAVVQLPAITHFDTAGSFYKALHNTNGVAIAFLSAEFLEFMSKNGAVVRSIPTATVHVHRIVKQMLGIDLVRGLNLSSRPIHLAHVYELMKQQPQGEKGALLVNRWPNSFVVGTAVDAKHVVRLRYFDRERARASAEAVPMHYRRNGWVVGLKSVNSPKWARMGEQIGFYD